VTIRSIPALSPFMLGRLVAVDGGRPGNPIPPTGFCPTLLALPPPDRISIVPPCTTRRVSAWIPSSPDVMRIVPLSIVTVPRSGSSSLFDCIPSAPARIVIVASLTVIESRPLIPSLTAATVTVAPLSAKSSLLWIPLL